MTRHAGGRGRSRRRAEDRSRSANVSVHARLGDPEQVGDLLRRKTAGDRAQHLTLTIGQAGDRPNTTIEDTPGEDIPDEDPDKRGSRPLHRRR